MAVQTGIVPQAIAELDAPMFDALVDACGEHWPVELELAALQLETTHALFRAFVYAHSPKSKPNIEPLTVKRPQAALDELPPPTPVVSVAEFVALTTPKVRGG
jgi:hypothetical protein